VEFVVLGDDRDVEAYLRGYLAASDQVRVVFAGDAGFHVPQVRERIRHRGEVQHVIVEAGRADFIRAALTAAAPRYHFEIVEEKPLRSARFEFECDTPSRGIADRVKKVLAGLPAGATLEGYEPGETQDAGSAGAELYTPSHDYSFRARGVIRGDVFAVADARAALSAIDFTKCEEISVERG
jgi:hypothetical protein